MFDQFFINDQEVAGDLVVAAEISNKDVVLEIGPGSGNVTKLLIQKAKKVIAIEIDQKFRPQLVNIPKVELIFGNVLDVLETKGLKFNKIVSSLPSSIVEPLMFRLVKIDITVASFLVPLIFVKKMMSNIVLCSYFSIEMLQKVPKEHFIPKPKTNWALVKLTKKKDLLKNGGYQDYLIQYLFEHPKAKLKNALMEVLIKIYKLKGNTITKNQSREVIRKIDFGEIDLEAPAIFNNELKTKIENLSAKICF